MNFSDIEHPSNRKFGFFFMFVFAAVAAYFYYSANVSWAYTFIAVASIFLLITLIKSDALLPLNRLWMLFGLLLELRSLLLPLGSGICDRLLGGLLVRLVLHKVLVQLLLLAYGLFDGRLKIWNLRCLGLLDRCLETRASLFAEAHEPVSCFETSKIQIEQGKTQKTSSIQST